MLENEDPQRRGRSRTPGVAEGDLGRELPGDAEDGEDLPGAELHGGDLPEAELPVGDLPGAEFRGGDLPGVADDRGADGRGNLLGVADDGGDLPGGAEGRGDLPDPDKGAEIDNLGEEDGEDHLQDAAEKGQGAD